MAAIQKKSEPNLFQTQTNEMDAFKSNIINAMPNPPPEFTMEQNIRGRSI